MCENNNCDYFRVSVRAPSFSLIYQRIADKTQTVLLLHKHCRINVFHPNINSSPSLESQSLKRLSCLWCKASFYLQRLGYIFSFTGFNKKFYMHSQGNDFIILVYNKSWESELLKVITFSHFNYFFMQNNIQMLPLYTPILYIYCYQIILVYLFSVLQ